MAQYHRLLDLRAQHLQPHTAGVAAKTAQRGNDGQSKLELPVQNQRRQLLDGLFTADSREAGDGVVAQQLCVP